MDLGEEQEADLRSIAAEVAWLRAEAAKYTSLSFLTYLLGMAEHEAGAQVALIKPLQANLAGQAGGGPRSSDRR